MKKTAKLLCSAMLILNIVVASVRPSRHPLPLEEDSVTHAKAQLHDKPFRIPAASPNRSHVDITNDPESNELIDSNSNRIERKTLRLKKAEKSAFVEVDWCNCAGSVKDPRDRIKREFEKPEVKNEIEDEVLNGISNFMKTWVGDLFTEKTNYNLGDYAVENIFYGENEQPKSDDGEDNKAPPAESKEIIRFLRFQFKKIDGSMTEPKQGYVVSLSISLTPISPTPDLKNTQQDSTSEIETQKNAVESPKESFADIKITVSIGEGEFTNPLIPPKNVSLSFFIPWGLDAKRYYCLIAGMTVKRVMLMELKKYNSQIREIDWCPGKDYLLGKASELPKEVLENVLSKPLSLIEPIKMPDQPSQGSQINSFIVTFKFTAETSIGSSEANFIANHLQDEIKELLLKDFEIVKDQIKPLEKSAKPDAITALRDRYSTWQPSLIRFLSVVETEGLDKNAKPLPSEVTPASILAAINDDICPFNDSLLCEIRNYIRRLQRVRSLKTESQDEKNGLQITLSNSNKVELSIIQGPKSNQFCVEIEVNLLNSSSNYLSCKRRSQDIDSSSMTSEDKYTHAITVLFEAVVKAESVNFVEFSQYDIAQFIAAIKSFDVTQLNQDSKVGVKDVLSQLSAKLLSTDLSGIDMIHSEKTVDFEFKMLNEVIRVIASLKLNDDFYKLSMESGSNLIELLIPRFPESVDLFKIKHNEGDFSIDIFKSRQKLKYSYLLTNYAASIFEFFVVIQKPYLMVEAGQEEEIKKKLESSKCKPTDAFCKLVASDFFELRDKPIDSLVLVAAIFRRAVISNNQNFIELVNGFALTGNFFESKGVDTSSSKPEEKNQTNGDMIKIAIKSGPSTQPSQDQSETELSDDLFENPALSDCFIKAIENTTEKAEMTEINFNYKEMLADKWLLLDDLLQNTKVRSSIVNTENSPKENSMDNTIAFQIGLPKYSKLARVYISEHNAGVLKVFHVSFQTYYFSLEYIVPVTDFDSMEFMFKTMLDHLDKHFKKVVKASKNNSQGSFFADFKNVEDALAFLVSGNVVTENGEAALPMGTICVLPKSDRPESMKYYYWDFSDVLLQESLRKQTKASELGQGDDKPVVATQPLKDKSEEDKAVHVSDNTHMVPKNSDIVNQKVETSKTEEDQNLVDNLSLLKGNSEITVKDDKMISEVDKSVPLGTEKPTGGKLPENPPNEEKPVKTIVEIKECSMTPSLRANISLEKSAEDPINPWTLSFSQLLKGEKANIPYNVSIRIAKQYPFNYSEILYPFLIEIIESVKGKTQKAE